MINNRQQTGRRRGRGGQRPGGGGGGNPGRLDGGNRIDNRARGNAAQLSEKYKSLASDAQRQGDRVNTEYYLQFADHYFRVLSESRARFEDGQPRPQQGGRDEFERQRSGRDDDDESEMDGDEEYGDEGDVVRPGDQMPGDRIVGDRVAQPQRQQQGGGNRQYEDRRPRQGEEDRRPRRDDRERQGGQQRTEGRPDGEGAPRAQQAAPESRAETVEPSLPLTAPEADAPQPRRRGRPRKEPIAETRGMEGEPGDPSGFDADRLPPALGVPANDGADDGEAVKPRRRRARGAETPAAE